MTSKSHKDKEDINISDEEFLILQAKFARDTLQGAISFMYLTHEPREIFNILKSELEYIKSG